MNQIIVDGYNYLFYTNKYSSRLNDGSTMLDIISDMLKDFQTLPSKIKKRLHFVFDGNKTALGNPDEQKISGYKLLFTKPGKSADQKIIEMVKNSRNPKSILVVTNDNEIINYVSRFQADTEKIPAFKNRILNFAIEYEQEKIKTKKVSPRLTKSELDDWMDYFNGDG